jgi:hypothetical protein
MPRSFGVYLTQPEPALQWKPREVVKRARGWHVSRETRDGQKTEFVLNEVRRVCIFRRLETAIAACVAANKAAA